MTKTQLYIGMKGKMPAMLTADSRTRAMRQSECQAQEDVVQRLLDDFANGKAPDAIADQLNAEKGRGDD